VKLNQPPLSEFQQLSHRSEEMPVLIFKHSPRCGISTMVKWRFERQLKKSDKTFHYVWLDVLKSRPFSNFIAEQTGVRHESPQLLVLQGGKTVWSASHSAVLDFSFGR